MLPLNLGLTISSVVNLRGGNRRAVTPPANGAARSRVVYSLLDQVMSSASNALVVFAVARVASVDAFGAAVLLFALATAAISICRGAVGTPIMLAAGRGHDDLRREAGFATTTALSLGLAVSGAAAVTSFLLGTPRMGAAFALAIPIVVVVDVFRYTIIAASRPGIAMMWDTIWAAGSALLFAITQFKPDAISDVTLVSLWAMFAIISAMGMGWNFRLRPGFRGIDNWWRATYGSRIRYGLESGLGQIKIIVITAISTAVIGAFAAASLRGAATLLSPLAVLLSALPLVIIPEAVRSGTSPTVVWRRLCLIGLVGSLSVITIGPALTLFPDRVGEFVLGESWSYARAVLPIISIEYAAAVWISIAMVFLRFQAKSRQLLTSTMAYTVISIILCTTMAFLTETAVGVAWALAASAAATATAITIYARPARERPV